MGCGSSTQTPVVPFNTAKDTPTTKDTPTAKGTPTERKPSLKQKTNDENRTPRNSIPREESTKIVLKEQNQNTVNHDQTIRSDTPISPTSNAPPWRLSPVKKVSLPIEDKYDLPGEVSTGNIKHSDSFTEKEEINKEIEKNESEEKRKTFLQVPTTSSDSLKEIKTQNEELVEEINETVVFDKKTCRIKSKTQPLIKRDKITIIHFNDVYNIESRDQEPIGGAARFVTKVRHFPNEPMVLFSGDCLNPSLMSTITKGKQMIPVLNNIGVHAAVYGNHDFDFGVDELIEFKNKTNFPWLMSNVNDKLTKTILADGIEKIIATWHGRKIGIIGLVEKEWLVTLATIDPEDVDYIDFIERAKELVHELKETEGCELIIALTHMRVPNDLKLLESDVPIDLVLGGHDHHYETKEHEGRVFVKSGTDFREFTEIEIEFTTDGNKKITTSRHEVTAEIEEDEETKEECDKYSKILGEKMGDILAVMHVDLDGRFSTVRTKESNLGNFVCDIMRAATQTDIALLNSGSLRSDTIHPAGPFKMKDLVTILPMVDCLVVLKVQGRVVLEALENSVSQYPKFEGRFLQVSGIKFMFDPEKPSGERIIRESVKVHESIPLDLDTYYTVTLKEYMARGKDGYDMLTDCEVIVDSENGPVLTTIIENHFQSIKIYKGRKCSVSGHRQSITVKHDEMQSFMEEQRSKLSPMIEGRITRVGEEEVKLSPSYIRRKSKLRVRTSTQHSVGTTSLQSIKESEGAPSEKVLLEKAVIEEIEKDDSDIDSVMESDENREAISNDDQLRIWEACTNDDLDTVKNIVDGRTLDFKFWIMEKTLLHHTTHHNSTKCLEYLIKETNLKVDVRDQILKSTALYYAAEQGSKDAALLLLGNGAKVNAKNSLWDTPLHAACENQQGELIILLLSRGADRTCKNKDGERAKI